MASLIEMIEGPSEYSFDRDLHKGYPKIVSGKGNYLFTSKGQAIFDAATGAAVSCLGHGNERVIKAITEQLSYGTPYLASSFWACDVVEKLCKELIRSTNGKMARVYLTGSGSEATEAAMKLARQYFFEIKKPSPRVNFIARSFSEHGNTIGALSVSSGNSLHRAIYRPLLSNNVHHVSSCYPYREWTNGESDDDFVSRKAAELEAKFLELGPETVIGFIAEPIAGAALGCIPAVPGYLKAMRDVCHKHGALFILDEVMCGMGRTGTLHAWQAEDVAPDIQIMGKGLGGGYQSIAALMISQKVVNMIMAGTGRFNHGLTFQSMPVQAAAALEVQRIIQENHLLDNVSTMGAQLGELLNLLLGNHPNVGDIRGRGLLWCIEFVKDKATKKPFSGQLAIAEKIYEEAITGKDPMTIYPGTACDYNFGDHIILAPPYTITREEVDKIVAKITAAIEKVFSKMAPPDLSPSYIEVSTTHPVIDVDNLPTISTNRLILRPLKIGDLEAYHSLQKQREPIFALSRSTPNTTVEYSKFKLEQKYSYLQKARFGIFLRNQHDDTEGDLIGEGTVSMFHLSTSSVYYVFKKEEWGKGYGSEFMRALMKFWWSLPREPGISKICVPHDYQSKEGRPNVPEQLCATTYENERSEKVLRKAGFKYIGTDYSNGDKCWLYPGL